MIALESPEEMPASPWEVEEAKAEGIEIIHRWGVKQIIAAGGKVTRPRTQGRGAGLRRRRAALRPPISEDQPTTREADVVILAIGQKTNLKFITEADGIKLTPRGLIETDPDTLATSREGVFAGGDVVTGPWIAIGAVAAGREAAISIDRYLEGRDLQADREPPLQSPEGRHLESHPGQDLPKEQREVMPELPRSEWTRGFQEINLGFSEEQAQAEAARCLNCGGCSECLQCVEACQAGAIDHQQQPRTQTLEVGALILAPGFKPSTPTKSPSTATAATPTSSPPWSSSGCFPPPALATDTSSAPATGPSPKKIAWIQCVGSRDASMGREYCSYVCCMYAAKQAIIAKEHDPRVEPTIFFIDFRAQGKGFDRYYERARDVHGVRLIRSMISRVTEDPRTHNLELTYVDEEGRIQTEEFDLVVLSVGLSPHPATRQAGGRSAASPPISWGFVQTPPFKMVETSRAGHLHLRRLPVPQGHPRDRGPGLRRGGGGRRPVGRSPGHHAHQGGIPRRTGHHRRGAPHRRLCLPLRHQHRRGGGRGPGERLRPDSAGGGLCRPLHLHLRHRLPGEDAPGDRGAEPQPGGGGLLQPPDPRAPLPGQPAQGRPQQVPL